MADITDAGTRSRMMGAIKGKDTFPELSVRRALHAKGFRFRLHEKSLAGKPDLVLPKWKAVVFVHGCFWHQHGCSNSNIPTTRREFWSEKLQSNVRRDGLHAKHLLDEGWRVAVVWECSIRQELKLGQTGLFEELSIWLKKNPLQHLKCNARVLLSMTFLPIQNACSYAIARP